MKTRRQQIADEVRKTVEERYAKRIALITVRTGDKSFALQQQLLPLAFEHVLLERAINDAKTLEEFDALLNEKEKTTQARIDKVFEMEKAATAKQMAEHHARSAALKLPLLKMIEEEKSKSDVFENPLDKYPELEKIMDEANAATEKAMKAMDEIDETLPSFYGHLLQASWVQLNEPMKKYRRDRKLRKLRQRLLRFFLAVLAGGVLYSFIWVFIKQGWSWVQNHVAVSSFVGLVIFIAILIFPHIIKEYKISPKIRGIRLEQERKDLIRSLDKFYEACFSNTIQAFLIRRRIFETETQSNDTLETKADV